MYLKLTRCLPERGVILIKLHCVGKHELNILRKLSSIRVFFALKVFLEGSLIEAVDNKT